MNPSRAVYSSTLDLLDASGRSRVTFGAGEPITFRLRVTNLTGESQTLHLPSAQLFDFMVQEPAGTSVWRWSNGQAFAAVVTPLDFGPHETRELDAVWSQKDDAGKAVTAGDYDASGLVPLNEPGLIADTVRFRIE